jgi:hypothetical protein
LKLHALFLLKTAVVVGRHSMPIQADTYSPANTAAATLFVE